VNREVHAGFGPADGGSTARKLVASAPSDWHLICCRRKQEAQEALQAVERALAQVKLQLNHHKSRVVHFDEGFQFLGVFFLRNEYFYLK
jgi:hypothetical protein